MSWQEVVKEFDPGVLPPVHVRMAEEIVKLREELTKEKKRFLMDDGRYYNAEAVDSELRGMDDLRKENAELQASGLLLTQENSRLATKVAQGQEREARLRAALDLAIKAFENNWAINWDELQQALDSTPEPRLAGVVRGLFECAKNWQNELEEGGAYLVEDGFEEPTHCEQFRRVTKALADAEPVLREMGIL